MAYVNEQTKQEVKRSNSFIQINHANSKTLEKRYTLIKMFGQKTNRLNTCYLNDNA